MADPVKDSNGVPNIFNDDPVIAEYDVFITPKLQEQLYLLQYLNRPPDQPLNRQHGSQPRELRVKQQSGFLEVDVPLDVHHSFNRPQAIRWGEAIRKTKAQGQKAWGLASGFERTNPPRPVAKPGAAPESSNPPAAEEADNTEEYLNNFVDANEKGHVLNTQTLGGQIIREEDPNAHYMVGTFRGNEFHLTKLDGVVQMRTQFNHLDAVSQLETQARRREKDAQEGTKPAQARAVIQQKRAAEAPSVEKARKFLQSTFDEPWTKLRYVDAEDDQAYATYEDTLFVQDTAAAAPLRSSMTKDEYLDAITAPSYDKLGKKKTVAKHHAVIDVTDDEDEQDEEENKENDEVRHADLPFRPRPAPHFAGESRRSPSADY